MDDMRAALARFVDATKPYVPVILVTVGAAALLAAIFYDPVTSFVRAIPKVITWPIAVLIIIVYLGSSSNATHRLSRLLGRFGSVKLLGSEVTFTSEGARQLFSEADHAFDDFKRQADQECQRQVRAQNLRERMARIFAPSDPDDGLNDLLERKDFRCTVHIEDVLFKDTLYQLLEYFPDPGGPAGRRFSIRFGMMGLAWRTKKDQGDGDAAATTKEDLVRHWGMTEDEARRLSRQRASYLCVMLETDRGDPMGILFMDADEKYAFGDKEQSGELGSRIREKSKKVGFHDGLEQIVVELRKYRAGIEIHG